MSGVSQKKKVTSDTETLSNTVLAGGYCIGCGVCTAVTGSKMEVKFNESGEYEACGKESANPALLRVCPFSNHCTDEDTISQELFKNAEIHDPRLGHYKEVLAGHVDEGTFRQEGSSGGLGKWILHELLLSGAVDGIIHVQATHSNKDNSPLYKYEIQTELSMISQGARSAYYPITLADVLSELKNLPGRFAIAGVPCFIKALRLLCREEPIYQEKFRYFLGLICGHLKSRFYADMLAWQFGIKPGHLGHIEFRQKLPGTNAKQKGIEVKRRDAIKKETRAKTVDTLFGADYNLGLFQYKACDYCDDVVAETADISIGDAWLPNYISDGRGTSLLIVRNPEILQLLRKATISKRIILSPISADQAAISQRGGLRQRREGLSYRLSKADKENNWRPVKRFQPRSLWYKPTRKKIYDQRTILGVKSKKLFMDAVGHDEWMQFETPVKKMIDQYKSLYKPSRLTRYRRGIARRFNRFYLSILRVFGV